MNLPNFYEIKHSLESQLQINQGKYFLRDLFQLREKKIIFESLVNQLNVLIEIQEDDDYIFSDITYKKLENYFNKVKKISNINLDFQEVQKIMSSMPNINNDVSFAVLDMFPEDYLLGVYLPLVIPLTVPILQYLIKILKRKLFKPK